MCLLRWARRTKLSRDGSSLTAERMPRQSAPLGKGLIRRAVGRTVEHTRTEEFIMSSTTVARVTTITARSPESFDAAIREGIARSHATLRNVSGAWVKEQKVECDDGTI